MFRQTKVTMMLADHAQAADGKLFISGGGWTTAGPVLAPFAIALSIEMPWDAAGVEHRFKLELVDASEGNPVLVPMPPQGDLGPLRFEAPFPVMPGVDSRRGTPLVANIAINFVPPPPIPAGGRYEWRCEVDGETAEDWRLGFSTRPEAQSNAA